MPIRRLRLLWAGLTTVGSLGCGGMDAAPVLSQDSGLPDIAANYPKPDAMLGEALHKNEIESAREIADIIAGTIQRKYPPGQARRDAHPKAHGCVRANFKVEANLDQRLAKGVFVPGAAYSAWVRFSNGNEDASRPDIAGDGRGMAIKLMNVEGDNFLKSQGAPGTQDFIMISYPRFLVNRASDYVSLVRTVNSTNSVVKFISPVLIPFAIGIKGTKIALATTSLQIESPLKTRYWSMVPYQLGEGPDRVAIKFSARPCSSQEQVVPKKPDDNYLRATMRETLKGNNACMEFLVQPRTSDKMSVENAQQEWVESEAPFYKVATIEIPSQEFDTAEQNTFCENLSMNPWHALPAHKPLGAMNRMRKVIYERISELRRSMNDAPRAEPHVDPPAH